MFLALSPVAAAGLGAGLLGKALPGTMLLGLARVALGIWLTHRSGVPPDRPDTAMPEALA